MSDWQARAVESTDAFLRDAVEVNIWRRLGDDRVEVITQLGGTGTISETIDAGRATPDSARLFLPRSALTALIEHLKPGASTAEIARLEDALAVERRRVDDVLLGLWRPS